MAKKKQLHDQEEFFVLNAEKVEVNKTVHVEIHDLIKRINDQENKKEGIVSPEFQVGDTSFTVKVYPQDWREDSKEYIAVYLHNDEKENVTATFNFKHASGAEETHENREFKADDGFGTNMFLSHKAYNEWAKDHGDVFKMKVQITLHIEKGPAQWTRNR